MNNTFLKSIILIGLTLISSMALAAGNSYFVTQSGSGSRDGQSLSSALSVDDFNSLRGTEYAGDSFYFSGEFTSRVRVYIEGTQSASVTIDGYQAGDCDPINSICTSSALLQRGLSVGAGKAGPDYLVIQDFRMTNANGGGMWLGAKIGGTDDEAHIDHTIVRRNYVFETKSNMIQFHSGRYNIVEGNKFVHFGQNGGNPPQGANFVDVDHSLIRGNEFGHDENAYPFGVGVTEEKSAEMIELHYCNYLLLEYNDIWGAPHQSGLRPKEYGKQNYIVARFNKIHDNHARGIHVHGPTEQSNQYYYANNIWNNGETGFAIGDYVSNIHLWSNLIHNNGRHGIVTWSGYSNPVNGLFIFNNTIVRNGGVENKKGRGGIVLAAGSNNIKSENNIIAENLPENPYSIYHQFFESVGAIFKLDYNIFYHTKKQSAEVYYNGALRNLDYLRNDGHEVNGVVADPMLADPSGKDAIFGTHDDDFTLNEGSPAIDSGADLTQNFAINISGGDAWFEAYTGYGEITIGYEDALNPITTDWTTSPPTVSTLKRNSLGWSKGAYVYIDGSTSKLAKPSNVEVTNIDG